MRVTYSHTYVKMCVHVVIVCAAVKLYIKQIKYDSPSFVEEVFLMLKDTCMCGFISLVLYFPAREDVKGTKVVQTNVFKNERQSTCDSAI